MGYMGFKKLEKKIEEKGGAKEAGAVVAAVGRKKYGKEKFHKAEHKSMKGRGPLTRTKGK